MVVPIMDAGSKRRAAFQIREATNLHQWPWLFAFERYDLQNNGNPLHGIARHFVIKLRMILGDIPWG